MMTVFFTGTPAAAFYGGTVGTAPIQYLEVSYLDLQYAQANPCPATPSPSLGYMSLQDLYARASRDIFAMANQVTALTRVNLLEDRARAGHQLLSPTRKAQAPPSPRIRGSRSKDRILREPGDMRIWQGSDFVGNTMPTKLDTVSATVNGKSSLCILHQPFAGEHPDSARCTLRSGPGDSDLQRSNQRRVYRSGAIALAFVFRFQRRTICSRNPRERKFDRAGHALSGRRALPPSLARPSSFMPTDSDRPTYPCKADPVNQSGMLSPLPVVKIGGVTATVQFAGLVAPGEFQFNVVVPASLTQRRPIDHGDIRWTINAIQRVNHHP